MHHPPQKSDGFLHTSLRFHRFEIIIFSWWFTKNNLKAWTKYRGLEDGCAAEDCSFLWLCCKPEFKSSAATYSMSAAAPPWWRRWASGLWLTAPQPGTRSAAPRSWPDGRWSAAALGGPEGMCWTSPHRTKWSNSGLMGEETGAHLDKKGGSEKRQRFIFFIYIYFKNSQFFLSHCFLY